MRLEPAGDKLEGQRDMATYSHWAKSSAAQALSINNHQPVRQSDIMNIAYCFKCFNERKNSCARQAVRRN
jgi:hypothetical protein